MHVFTYVCVRVCACTYISVFFWWNMCKPHAWLPPPGAVLAFRSRFNCLFSATSTEFATLRNSYNNSNQNELPAHWQADSLI